MTHCSVTAVTGKAYLVNRSVFPTEILPVVSFVSALIPHVFLIAILFGFLFAYDIPLSIWALQIVYLTVCLGILGIGLGWLVASINVFYRDVGQIVTIVLNIWFWMTPIIWRIDMLPENMHGVLRLNPLYHVTEAYRAAFLFGKPVWLDASGMANFWVFTLLVFLLGAFVFRRLKPEFADVI